MTDKHIDVEALEQVIKVLHMRVRLLEMLVVRHFDGEQVRELLDGTRNSLYQTGEYYLACPNELLFESINPIREGVKNHG